MDMPDLPAPTPHPAGDDDPLAALLARQAAELAALRARLRDLEAVLGLPAHPGRPAPPTLPALLRRVAALERHAGLVPGLAPLPVLGRPICDGAAPAAASRLRVWGDRLPAAGALAGLLALLLWLMHPGLPAGHGSGAAASPTASAAIPTMPTGQAAFSQGYYVPGPFDFREDHRQIVVPWDSRFTYLNDDSSSAGSDQFTYREDHRQPVATAPAATPGGR